MPLEISPAGVEFIKQFEGFSANSYLCPAGVWTIGYGTTVIDGKKVRPGMSCTKEQALMWLTDDVNMYLNEVEGKINPHLNLTQGQVDAIASFVYNVGSGNFNKSTLLRLMNSGDFSGAADQFLRWNKSGGKVLAGLTRRREAERAMFLGGVA